MGEKDYVKCRRYHVLQLVHPPCSIFFFGVDIVFTCIVIKYLIIIFLFLFCVRV